MNSSFYLLRIRPHSQHRKEVSQMEKGKLHQYFDSNIQPILNMAIGVLFMTIGYLLGHMS
ncbi:hypothetical protein LBSP_22740 [Lentilactobacillus buchneri subsp. silagei]|nr:hypothetical protein LBSP_22740 [Lentilactobacillus buchneri subsp. silagei]